MHLLSQFDIIIKFMVKKNTHKKQNPVSSYLGEVSAHRDRHLPT